MASELAGVNAYRLLLRSAQAGRVPHAILFTGPDGTGKKTAALELAMLANCTGTGEKPCRLCKSCRLALAGEHPNLTYLRLGSKSASIRTDDLRDILTDISGSGTVSGMRAVICEQASWLSQADQNLLLKTLESPPPDTMFIFVSNTAAALLPTVLSRVTKVAMNPISAEDVRFVLKKRGFTDERAEMLASLSDGCVGKALAMENDEEYWKLRSDAKKALGALKKPYDAFVCAEMLPEPKSAKNNRDRENLRRERLFDILELWARDKMRMEHGLEPGETGDKEFLEGLAFSGEKLLKELIRARMKSAAHIRWQYTLETLFLSLF